ncbi:MAG TPA: NADH-quinone oxidoreductase subunit H, partial [Actinomycetota bacterium]
MKKTLLIWTAIGFIIGTIFVVSAAAYALGGLLETWLGSGWAWLSNFLILLFGFVMIIATVLTLAERKWSAMIQDRVGPNRARIGLPG